MIFVSHYQVTQKNSFRKKVVEKKYSDQKSKILKKKTLYAITQKSRNPKFIKF
jgi:hypothetical protein